MQVIALGTSRQPARYPYAALLTPRQQSNLRSEGLNHRQKPTGPQPKAEPNRAMRSAAVDRGMATRSGLGWVLLLLSVGALLSTARGTAVARVLGCKTIQLQAGRSGSFQCAFAELQHEITNKNRTLPAGGAGQWDFHWREGLSPPVCTSRQALHPCPLPAPTGLALPGTMGPLARVCQGGDQHLLSSVAARIWGFTEGGWRRVP